MPIYKILKAGKVVASVGHDSPTAAIRTARQEFGLSGALTAKLEKKRPKKRAKKNAAKKAAGRMPAAKKAAATKKATRKKSAGKKTTRSNAAFAHIAKQSKKAKGARSIGAAAASKAVAKSKNAKAKKGKAKGKPKRNGGRKPVKQRNSGGLSAATDRYEYFHGKGPDVVEEFIEERIEHDTQSGIGKLIALEVFGMDGDLQEVNGFKGARLTQDTAGTQLFIVGGDQSVDPEDYGVETNHIFEVLGAVKSVTYATEKTHLGAEGGKAHYKHEFGDNGGALPLLIYDTVNEELMFAGGSYSIPSQGIAD